MTHSRANRSAAGIVAVLCAIISTFAFSDFADAGDDKSHVGVILSGLPKNDSPAYKALHAVAGRPSGAMLEMTAAEMWNVPRSKLKALENAAAKQGIPATRLDQTWNHMLAPMQGAAPMTAEQERMMHETMASKAAMGMSMMSAPMPAMVEYALTKDMEKTSEGVDSSELVLPLTKTVTVTARRTRISKTADGYIWHGEIKKTGEPVTLLWWPSGRLTGSVTYLGHKYVVKNIGGMMHGVVDMSPKDLPPEHEPMAPQKMKEMNLGEDPLVKKGDASALRPEMRPAPNPDPPASDPPASERPDRSDTKALEDANINAGAEPKSVIPKPFSAAPHTMPERGAKLTVKPAPVTIKLMIAYTQQAASHYENIETDLVALAVEETNQALRNSGIGHVQLDLVHIYRTDYVEKGSHFDHVFGAADKGDGVMEKIHGLRDTYSADVVLLIVHDPHGCGLAAGVGPPPDRAFAVVHHECAATKYSLAHELGHLFGARHDLALDNSTSPFPYGHGFVNGTRWRTMMSYEESCKGCPRLPVFSNPDVKIKGVRAGNELSNNARVIAERAAAVAGFR